MAASADYRAAEARARAAGRLWGRWTRGYREARQRAAALKVVHEEGLDEAGTLLSQEEKTSWLLDWLAERTDMAANVVSVRWTQRSCVGHFELGISFLELPRYAAARVIGQTTVALMLNGLISDDSYGRLLEPWHQSMARPPLPLDGPVMLEDPGVGTPARPIVPAANAPIAPRDREGDNALRLTALLELVHRADGMQRIEYRDQVAAFGREAIEPMSGWLADPRLGAFAARVLGKIALTTDAEVVHDALRKRLPDISAPSVRDDVQGILHKLGPAIQLTQTREWMAAQATRGDGAQWTSGDAERLVDKVERLDARRQAAGKPPLSASNREHALAIQFKGFGTRPYTNHCWTPGCGGSIDSEINARCDACNMFFCDSCGACMCGRG